MDASDFTQRSASYKLLNQMAPCLNAVRDKPRYVGKSSALFPSDADSLVGILFVIRSLQITKRV